MNNFSSPVLCETSVASDGNMDFRFGLRTEVIKNRTRFLEQFGIAYQEHVAMRCDHGEIITVVDHNCDALGASTQEDQVHSEVLITQKKYLALMLFTADCQPVSFFDPVTQTIALAHISRKTITHGLSCKTIAFLEKKLGVNPKDLYVHIGPSILKASYAFTLPLTESHPSLEPFTHKKGGSAYIDLVGAHVEKLSAAGVKPENILLSGEDTAVGGKYFSHYVLKKNGETQEARMATILMMR